MENDIKKLKDEILMLREAIRWLTSNVADNNNWIGKLNGEIETSDFDSNKTGYENRLNTIIGKE